jgi:hypothetical protein
VPDLALRDEVTDGRGDVFDRYVWVDPVLVEQIDAVGPQPLQHLVDDLADVVRSAVESSRFELETEFRGEHDRVADRFERATRVSFVRGPYASALSKSVIPWSWAPRMRLMPCSMSTGWVSIVGAEAHAAEPDR